MMPFLWSAMKPRPSLWNFSPFGSPSYSAATLTSPLGVILKIRPHGMSVTYRFPARSNEGPSRKFGVGAPCSCVSTQIDVRPLKANLSGIRAKTFGVIDAGAANIPFPPVRIWDAVAGAKLDTAQRRMSIPISGYRSDIRTQAAPATPPAAPASGDGRGSQHAFDQLPDQFSHQPHHPELDRPGGRAARSTRQPEALAAPRADLRARPVRRNFLCRYAWCVRPLQGAV